MTEQTEQPLASALACYDWAAADRPPDDNEVEWRVQTTGLYKSGQNEGKPWATLVPYITRRCVQKRLLAVFGRLNFRSEVRETMAGSEAGYVCRLGIRDPRTNEFVWVEDGSETSNTSALKGGISGAYKRAATWLGIGACLYDLPTVKIEPKQINEGWAPWGRTDTLDITVRDGNRYSVTDGRDQRSKPTYRGWCIVPKMAPLYAAAGITGKVDSEPEPASDPVPEPAAEPAPPEHDTTPAPDDQSEAHWEEMYGKYVQKSKPDLVKAANKAMTTMFGKDDDASRADAFIEDAVAKGLLQDADFNHRLNTRGILARLIVRMAREMEGTQR